MTEKPIIRRAWAMPHPYTFGIPPITELLSRVMGTDNAGWADPFAGHFSPAAYRNDLSPDSRAEWHMDAVAWCRDVVPTLPMLRGVLVDPPYSPRQMSEVYKAVGMSVGMAGTQSARLYAAVKDALAPRVAGNGLAICCGWNSAGFGTGRGFELLEILLVAHGGAHNDTIVTVERKVPDLFAEAA